MKKLLFLSLAILIISCSAWAKTARMQFTTCPDETVEMITQNNSIIISQLQKKYSQLDITYETTSKKLITIANKYDYRCISDMAYSIGTEEKNAKNIDSQDRKDFENLYELLDNLNSKMEENGLAHCVQIIEERK